MKGEPMTAALLAVLSAAIQEKPDLPYVELEGTVEEFRSFREWRSYYWREDFTLVLRDDARKAHRVISREPTPWNDLRLGTTYTGVRIDPARRPRARIIGVRGVDRTPAEFYGLRLDERAVTAFIVRLRGDDGAWKDFYINNWLHRWGADADRKVLAHYATEDPNYTVYGYAGGIAAPFDAEGKALLEKHSDYGGVIYHARVVKAGDGFELRALHLMGRHKTTLRYEVFHGDPAGLVRLDARKPRFVNVSEGSGLKVAANMGVGGTNPHGVAVEDFDGDGRLDIVIVTFGAPCVKYFRNAGGLKFTERTAGSGLETFRGEGTGAAVGDVDRDGRLDLYLTSLRGGPSRLYLGKGDGTFEDVSEKAGALVPAPARSCAFSDVDGDGWLDLYVTRPGAPNVLLRNRGDGTFADIAREAGVELAERESLGCAFGDVDGDGLDDLFVTNYKSQASVLFKNLGGGKFRDVTSEAGVGRRSSAVGCVFGDVFNRGRLDLYVTTDSWLSGANATEGELLRQGHTVEPNVLYVNDGGGRFAPLAEPAFDYKSLSHDAALEDLDHDGAAEVYVAVDAESGNAWATSKGGNPLWTRSGGTWQEAGGAWGVDHQGNCVQSPAADFDSDGDLDLLLVNFYTPLVLYRNDTNGRGWLQVRAGGKRSNPNGIGAKVTVRAADGKLAGFRQIQSGAGYGRSSPLEAHFGLAPAEAYRVEVFFPATRARVVRENVKPGRRIVVAEE